MCIISFFKENNQVLLTHNRDESISRKASLHVEKRIWEGKSYYAPVDQEKQGTWIFYNEDYIACLLNGGKVAPTCTRSDYKRSRGLVLLDVMKYPNVEEFVDKEDFNDIAPFTMLIYNVKNKNIHVLFWDEKQLEVNDLSDKNFVYRCSSTLYSPEKMNELQRLFPNFNEMSASEIFALHQSIQMKDGDIAPGKATTSITQIIADNSEISMKYCPFF
ncbi:MAG: NRDE family protein [Weeksellaceae bacterium]|nr:NRDE family protein [Weeksellaceae bacterium]